MNLISLKSPRRCIKSKADRTIRSGLKATWWKYVISSAEFNIDCDDILIRTVFSMILWLIWILLSDLTELIWKNMLTRRRRTLAKFICNELSGLSCVANDRIFRLRLNYPAVSDILSGNSEDVIRHQQEDLIHLGRVSFLFQGRSF